MNAHRKNLAKIPGGRKNFMLDLEELTLLINGLKCTLNNLFLKLFDNRGSISYLGLFGG